MVLYPLTRKVIKRAERKEIFQWKILVKSQTVGEEEKEDGL